MGMRVAANLLEAAISLRALSCEQGLRMGRGKEKRREGKLSVSFYFFLYLIISEGRVYSQAKRTL